MKIIHCADIHLDSPLSTNFDEKQAVARRNELLLTFSDMVEYAAKNSVRAIIIAGDLFDNQRISRRAKEIVADCIRNNKDIDFLYLPGNHGEQALIDEFKEFDNLKTFFGKVCSYRYGDVVITGLPCGEYDADSELTQEQALCASLKLLEKDINIVVRHGEIKNPLLYTGKYIDYLALGHIHKHIEGKMNARGTYCYSGCLEARGFDECGEQGFILLDINDTGVEHKFVPFGRRHAWKLQADVSKIDGNVVTLCEVIEKYAENIDRKDMVSVSLVGEISAETNINADYIRSYFKDRFFAFRLEDKTKISIDWESIKDEKSLKGYFIKNVLAAQLPDDMKKDIIMCGIGALAGEAVEECI